MVQLLPDKPAAGCAAQTASRLGLSAQGRERRAAVLMGKGARSGLSPPPFAAESRDVLLSSCGTRPGREGQELPPASSPRAMGASLLSSCMGTCVRAGQQDPRRKLRQLMKKAPEECKKSNAKIYILF